MKKLKTLKKWSPLYIKTTFKALVDATIPKTPSLAKKQDGVQLFGGCDLNVEDYQIWILNHSITLNIFKVNFKVSLSKATGKLLDIAAMKLIDESENKEPIDSDLLSKAGAFAALAPNDRFRAIELLEQLKVNLARLPFPFWNNRGLVVSIIDNIIMFNTFGYYSGNLKLEKTDIENQEKYDGKSDPISWQQVNYPGPSNGYHALRN